MYLPAQLNGQRIELNAVTLIFAAMKLKHLFTALVIVLSIQACKNDIEINAPWKETPVIYGFMDLGSTTQYIRITKTFQNSANLTPEQAAQLSDSLYFDTLVVSLYDVTVPALPPVSFIRTNTVPKDQGYFANDKNYLYTANFRPRADRIYKLVIYNPKSTNKYEATTAIVDTAAIMKKSPYYLLSIDYSTPVKLVTYNWAVAGNSAIYDGAIQYVYTEDGVTKSIEQIIAPGVSSGDGNNFNPRVLNDFLKAYFKDKPSAARVMTQIYYVVYAGSSDLAYAVSLNRPISGLLQVKPEFTNVSGGLGLFTSRSSNKRQMFFKDNNSRVNLTQGVNGF
jgi:hypothetical protein